MRITIDYNVRKNLYRRVKSIDMEKGQWDDKTCTDKYDLLFAKKICTDVWEVLTWRNDKGPV